MKEITSANFIGHSVSESTLSEIVVSLSSDFHDKPITSNTLLDNTDISRPTMTRALSLLVEFGLIEEGPEIKSGQRGRPPRTFARAEDFDDKIGQIPSWRRAVALRNLADRMGTDEGTAFDFLLKLGNEAVESESELSDKEVRNSFFGRLLKRAQ